MAKTSPVRLLSSEEYKRRRELSASLVHEVNQGSYSPRNIHGFLSAPKSNSVARLIHLVVSAASQKACEQFVFDASAMLHKLGLNINAGKVRYCSKKDFERYWGFVLMDRFESGSLVEGLSALEKAMGDDGFGRRTTALKRVITLVDLEPGLRRWRAWVRDTVLDAGMHCQLSHGQLLALIRLHDDTPVALHRLVPVFLDQPFTQRWPSFSRPSNRSFMTPLRRCVPTVSLQSEK
jgi:hypothetical protein